jgi:hypothetical protein
MHLRHVTLAVPWVIDNVADSHNYRTLRNVARLTRKTVHRTCGRWPADRRVGFPYPAEIHANAKIEPIAE